MGSEDTPIPGPLNNVIRIDDERIKGHLDRIVRGTLTLLTRLAASIQPFARSQPLRPPSVLQA